MSTPNTRSLRAPVGGERALGFLADIAAKPDDDTPRLIFADWLEDNAQAEVAEFIRVQVQSQSEHLRPRFFGGGRAMYLRERPLERHVRAIWLAGWPDVQGVGYDFHRGLPRIVADDFRAFRRHASALAGLPGAYELQLERTAGIEMLPETPEMTHFSTLDLSSTRLGTRCIAALSNGDCMCNLVKLNLDGTGIRLPQATPPGRIEALSKLMHAPHLRRLQSIDLSGNRLRVWAGNVFRVLRNLTALEHVDLSCTYMPQSGVALLVRGVPPTLRALGLAHTMIGDRGALELAQSARMAAVTALDLSACSITAEGALALVESPHLSRLVLLNLRFNHIGGEVRGRLRERFGERVAL
jgi:uncharacterized protein (TIGR02996 family)